jgi:hypothetical protein
MSSISAIPNKALSLESASHFSLQKTNFGIRLVEEDSLMPEIVCRAINKKRLSHKNLEQLKNKEIVIIDASGCKQETDRAVNEVAIDVKKLSRQLHINQEETVSLLESPELFDRLSLIALSKTLLKALKIDPNQTTLTGNPSDFIEKISQAITLAVNHGVIQNKDELLDAFKSHSSKVLMVLSKGDQKIRICRIETSPNNFSATRLEKA